MQPPVEAVNQCVSQQQRSTAHDDDLCKPLPPVAPGFFDLPGDLACPDRQRLADIQPPSSQQGIQLAQCVQVITVEQFQQPPHTQRSASRHALHHRPVADGKQFQGVETNRDNPHFLIEVCPPGRDELPGIIQQIIKQRPRRLRGNFDFIHLD